MVLPLFRNRLQRIPKESSWNSVTVSSIVSQIAPLERSQTQFFSKACMRNLGDYQEISLPLGQSSIYRKRPPETRPQPIPSTRETYNMEHMNEFMSHFTA